MTDAVPIPDPSIALPTLPAAYDAVAFRELTSTQDEAKRRAALPEGDPDRAEDGTLILALRQTEGRGRRGKTWLMEEGDLALSIVLRPECSPAEAAQLSFVAAVALGNALGAVVPPMVELRYKWPNDVLLSDRKAAGILLESATRSDGTLDRLVLGVGVNLVSSPPDDAVETPATSLALLGAETDSAAVLQGFCRHFMSWAGRWLDEGFAPVRAAWRPRAKGLGETIRVRRGAEDVEGVFADLDEAGRLVLDRGADGLVTIAAGDVFFPDDSDAR